MINFADDMVLKATTKEEMSERIERIKGKMLLLGMKLNTAKTEVYDFREDQLPFRYHGMRLDHRLLNVWASTQCDLVERMRSLIQLLD